MTIIVNFNVRNPEWFWSHDKIKEYGDYEEWKLYNDGKVPKHTPTWGYQVAFDVKDVKENRNAVYDLNFSTIDAPDKIQSLQLQDMTHLIFMNDEERVEVAVSNEIIHSYMGAQQRGGKYYYYVFIKEDVEFERPTDTVWLSKGKLF
jgi:hypothetical protein